MWPLSFSEFLEFADMDQSAAWGRIPCVWGMPFAVLAPTETERETYLKGLFSSVYQADIVERYGIDNTFALEQLTKELARQGSLTNPEKLANTLNTVAHAGISNKTVKRSSDAPLKTSLFRKAERVMMSGANAISTTRRSSTP